MFSNVHENNNDQLLIAWWTNSAINIEFVVFYFICKQYQLCKKYIFIIMFTQYTHDDRTITFEAIKV
jgi:hypothetical protein